MSNRVCPLCREEVRYNCHDAFGYIVRDGISLEEVEPPKKKKTTRKSSKKTSKKKSVPGGKKTKKSRKHIK